MRDADGWWTGYDSSMRRRLLLLALVVALSCDTPGRGSPPPDAGSWLVVAHYSPGRGPGPPWETRIAANGAVEHERIGSDEPEVRRSQLDRPALQRLVRSIASADFKSLERRYAIPLTDQPELALTVQVDGSSKAVSVYAPWELASDRAVRRFLSVWDEVLRVVPSPNPNQRPGDYLERR
jgi:hypothetical protein